jgi:hypothetical protein
MAINGQTQPQKFSLYRYREGKSDLEHGKWFKRQDQGGPNKRAMQRLLLTLGLETRDHLFGRRTVEQVLGDQSSDLEKYPVRERTVMPASFGRIAILRNVSSRIGFEG